MIKRPENIIDNYVDKYCDLIFGNTPEVKLVIRDLKLKSLGI